jgi:hypothetical protein
MKREIELVRLILLALEGDDEARSHSEETYAKDVRAYHVQLMLDADLVEGQVLRDANGVPADYCVIRMTWDGHDFLDAARDETLWVRAKQQVLKAGVSWTFELLKEWLKSEASRRLSQAE